MSEFHRWSCVLFQTCLCILIGRIDLVSNGHSETSAVRLDRFPFCTPRNTLHDVVPFVPTIIIMHMAFVASKYIQSYLYTREQDLHHITHVVFSDEVHTCKSIVILRDLYAKERMRPLSRLLGFVILLLRIPTFVIPCCCGNILSLVEFHTTTIINSY
jgi:hypothetical protein